MNCINTDYFKPFLQAFCEKTQPLYTCGYPWGPFVPYTMPRYNDADVKIFYMGRDTYMGHRTKRILRIERKEYQTY
jgi:hypothetical protein